MADSQPPYSVQISPWRHDDSASFETLLKIVRPLQMAAFHWPEFKLKAQLQVGKTFVAHLQNGRAAAFVTCVDVGAAVELPVLATDKEFQGRGVMKALLEAVIAVHYPGRELWLEVHEGNVPARKLYKKLGFIESGQRSNYYLDKSAAILCTRKPS